jgi:hypothetical protein
MTVKNDLWNQGTVGGPLACCSVVDELPKRAMEHNAVLKCHGISIPPVCFVEDSAAMSWTLPDLIKTNLIAQFVQYIKGLKLNSAKCELIIFTKKNIPDPLVQINSCKKARVYQLKYLSQIFGAKGNSSSLTARDRMQKATSCLACVKHTLKYIMNCDNYTQTALLLYDSVFLPILTFGSETWHDISKSDLDALDKHALGYFKQIFSLPSSISSNGIYIILKILPASFHIHYKQLNYIYKNLTSCNDVIRELTKEQWMANSRWSNSMRKIMDSYGINMPDINLITAFKRKEWKNITNNYIYKKLHHKLTIEVSGRKKTSWAKTLLCSNHMLWSPLRLHGSWQSANAEIRWWLYAMPTTGNQCSRGSIIRLCPWCESSLDTHEHFTSCTATSQMTLDEKINAAVK